MVILVFTILALVNTLTAQEAEFSFEQPDNCRVSKEQRKPLDDYVYRADPNYQYSLINEYRNDESTSYILNMTSQKWRDEKFSSRPIWWHYLVITIPDNVEFSDAGFLFVDGGRNSDTPPDDGNVFVFATTIIAEGTGTVTAILFQVPNQPTWFANQCDNQKFILAMSSTDPEVMKMGDDRSRTRSEDAAIARTWRAFMENPSDPEVIIRFPMVKAAVRALDTMQAFSKSQVPGIDLQRFYVAGGSKRGWVTWLTAAVDKRVVAASPMVMSMLNYHENLHTHYRNLGGWSFAFGDYYKEGITKHLDDERTKKLMEHEDPFSYKDRFTIPILLHSATGDEFFLVDNSDSFWSQMPASNQLVMMENSHHSLFPHWVKIVSNVMGYWTGILKKIQMPTLTWKRTYTEEGATIEAHVHDPAGYLTEVVAHSADSADGGTTTRRDFRWFQNTPEGPEIQPIFWDTQEVKRQPGQPWSVSFPKPTSGYRGFLMEFNFILPDGHEFMLTTEVAITPNTHPFPDCTGVECEGKLV